MNNDDRKISVVMCTYNGEHYLEEQLNSILSQSYPASEIMIVDDCSSDQTWDILLKYKEQYPDLFCCERNSKNVGYHINFVEALQKASGDFIAISDQDDIWKSDKLEVMIQNIGDNFLLVSNSQVVDIYGKTIGKLYEKMNIQDFSLEKLIWENCIYGHSCMIHRTVVSLLYSCRGLSSHDYTIALICSSFGSIAVIDQELQQWRRHSEATTWHSQHANNESTKRRSGVYKAIAAFVSLLILRKSVIVKDGFLKINEILDSLSDENGLTSNFEEIKNSTILLSKQTLTSYLKVAFLCMRFRKNRNYYAENDDFKTKLITFSFVFRWWYDHRYSMS